MTPSESPETPAPAPDKPAVDLHSGFFDQKKNIDRIYYGLLAVCVALTLADFTYHKHGHFDFEEIPAFHAGFGFLAYVGLVLTATQLRRLLKRKENYYD